MAIALRTFERKADAYPVAGLSGVKRREITENSVPDPVAFGMDVDRFSNLERRILLDRDVAREIEDALIGLGRGGGGEQQERNERPPEHVHRQAAGRSNETLGADWMLGSSSW